MTISLATLGIALRAIVLAVIIYFVGRWVIRLLHNRFDRVAERTKMDAGVTKFMHSVITVLCYALIIYCIADLFGVPTASFVALIGTIGLTVGLALQGSLANLAAGIQLLVLHPFRVGDLISAAGVDGVVDEVGLFATRVITLDNKEVSVPNSTLTGAVITNVSSLEERRIDFSVGISYKSDVKRAKQVITDLINAREDIIRKDDTIVYVDELGSSAVRLGVRYWTHTADYWAARWEVIEETKAALEANGITIPFQQIDVHLDK